MLKSERLRAAAALLILLASPVGPAAAEGSAGQGGLEYLAPLPQAVSNNAVTLFVDDQGVQLISAMGLGAGKAEQDISDAAWRYSSDEGAWKALETVPGGHGRLAASAVTAGDAVYLFGGYTVAEDGSETSTSEVYRLSVESGQWVEFSQMPVPVDDAVVVSYLERYVYLVSGWHDVGNVNLVQVLDTHSGKWQQATPYPGSAVFGHAGSLSGNTLLICDGVRVDYPADGSARQFLISDECWLGKINAEDHRRIHWQPVPKHPGTPRYRMAAGNTESGEAWFVGGSVNPYNYDGVGYNGEPSGAESIPFSYEFSSAEWRCHPALETATMDHRGLPWSDGWFYVIGGMGAHQKVSNSVFRFTPTPAVPC